MHRYLDLGQKANVISESPQWGSNSKVGHKVYSFRLAKFQSPQWGSNSKAERKMLPVKKYITFQSPQWGSNSKENNILLKIGMALVSVPAMGK